MDLVIRAEHAVLDREVFLELLENSVVTWRALYIQALERDMIHYPQLLDLARLAEVPHPLFFAPLATVQAQTRIKTDKLLQGVSPSTFTVNTRATVKLRDVELIVKDLLRKQSLAKKYDSTLEKNRIVGLLRQLQPTVREDAETIVTALGLDQHGVRNATSKEKLLEALIERLEANQILVSRSVRGYMPQPLVGLRLSGMTVRDSKVPYIFLAGGDHGDSQEPTGRQIFTLVLMAVLVARGIFTPVSYDANSTAATGREYDIAGEILMPADELRDITLGGLEDIKAAANLLKVTPSALTVRAMRLRLLDPDTASGHLQILEAEFRSRPKPGPRQQPKPVNAIRKYSGRALTSRMLRAVAEHRLSEGEFCRVVCLNRINPQEIADLRDALR